MAVVSSHTLNGVDGSHAGGIPVSLRYLESSELIFESTMDENGRLSVDLGEIETAGEYEMIFDTGGYWQDRVASEHGSRILDKVVVRFRMPTSVGRYHIPLIISPNSYSLWASTEHG